MNYCINAARHGDNQPVALLRCNEAQVDLIAAFRSSALLGLATLIFLLTIPHIFSIGIRSGEFAGQSSTVTPSMLIEPAFGTFGSVGRCQVLLENENLSPGKMLLMMFQFQKCLGSTFPEDV